MHKAPHSVPLPEISSRKKPTAIIIPAFLSNHSNPSDVKAACFFQLVGRFFILFRSLHLHLAGHPLWLWVVVVVGGTKGAGVDSRKTGLLKSWEGHN